MTWCTAAGKVNIVCVKLRMGKGLGCNCLGSFCIGLLLKNWDLGLKCLGVGIFEDFLKIFKVFGDFRGL
jgi:hypothetical protein